MTENEIMKQIEEKKIFLRTTNRELKRFEDELNSANKADADYSNTHKKACELLCRDPIPRGELAKAKTKLMRAHESATNHRRLSAIEANIAELKKRIANRNSEILGLSREIIKGWTAEQ